MHPTGGADDGVGVFERNLFEVEPEQISETRVLAILVEADRSMTSYGRRVLYWFRRRRQPQAGRLTK